MPETVSKSAGQLNNWISLEGKPMTGRLTPGDSARRGLARPRLIRGSLSCRRRGDPISENSGLPVPDLPTGRPASLFAVKADILRVLCHKPGNRWSPEELAAHTQQTNLPYI